MQVSTSALPQRASSDWMLAWAKHSDQQSGFSGWGGGVGVGSSGCGGGVAGGGGGGGGVDDSGQGVDVVSG